jgi:hypothetical protein
MEPIIAELSPAWPLRHTAFGHHTATSDAHGAGAHSLHADADALGASPTAASGGGGAAGGMSGGGGVARACSSPPRASAGSRVDAWIAATEAPRSGGGGAYKGAQRAWDSGAIDKQWRRVGAMPQPPPAAQSKRPRGASAGARRAGGGRAGTGRGHGGRPAGPLTTQPPPELPAALAAAFAAVDLDLDAGPDGGGHREKGKGAVESSVLVRSIFR